MNCSAFCFGEGSGVLSPVVQPGRSARKKVRGYLLRRGQRDLLPGNFAEKKDV